MKKRLIYYFFSFLLICSLKSKNVVAQVSAPDARNSTLTCNNWLSTPSLQSFVRVGEIDVPGNKITVEAVFNRTAPYSGGPIWAGDLVSKHKDPIDVNYLLRPNSAEITTTNGYFIATASCEIELNKTYHAAMVYDGVNLKFYRNGFLMKSVPVTGNMVQNNFQTQIGLYEAALHNEQFIGYINEVRIWNVARTQAEIKANMDISLPNPTTQTGLLAYYTFDNLLNKQGNPAWNGILVGSASINATNPECNFTIDSCRVASCATKNDFSYSRNPCLPLDVGFQTNATGFNSIQWDFGDGNNLTGSTSGSNTYASTGNFTVSMITNYAGCSDTSKKTITVDLQQDNQLIQTPDTTICFGSTKNLRTIPSLDFCWTPTTYLDNPNLAEPTTSTPHNITYYFTAEVTGANIIANGSFENGNTGFSSEYNYATPNTTEGQYYISGNPPAWNANMSNCKDHTTGFGNMMLINGAPVPDVNVWKQTVTVTPNTNYAFSTWIQALWHQNMAELQFSINGKTIGSLISASLPTCTWTQFYTNWNSGNNTTAVISIVNRNTNVIGNDFALDDISFAPVYMKWDSVAIKVDTPYILTNPDITICKTTPLQINTTGAATYSWTPATGLNDPSIGNPVATVSSPIQYVVTGINNYGCADTDTLNITIFPDPVITKSRDTTICTGGSAQLSVTGGNTYVWSPATSLDNPTSPTPVASPTDSTLYYVSITDFNSCQHLDSIKVDVRSPSSLGVISPPAICKNDPVRLQAFGGDLYLWSPGGETIPDPVVAPSSSTIYQVRITDTLCHNVQSFNTVVNVYPEPNLQVLKSNDIDCRLPQSNLQARGGVIYTWSPANTLTNTTGSSTIAKPLATTVYTVNVTDINGCKNEKFITVNVTKTDKPGFFMPTGFTPNNDGKNDCYEIKDWGSITSIEFSIYNRWGERVFYSTQPGQCWDGRLNGLTQDPGVFVYMVRASTTCEDNIFRKGTFVLIR